MPRWRVVSRPVRVPGRSERCSSALGGDPWLRRARSVATRSTILANASNVAAALQILEPSTRLVAVHACRPGGHRRGERARQLGQRRSYAIRAPLGPALPPALLRRHGRFSRARNGFQQVRRLASEGRIVPEAGSAVAAQDDRLAPGRADDLKPTRSTTRVADTAPPRGGFYLDQVFGTQSHSPSP